MAELLSKRSTAEHDHASPNTDEMTVARPQFYAMRVLRLATKTALAQHHGTDVLALLTVIACQEDARRYRGPVAFFNAQLLPLLGFRKWERLDRARRAAIKAGWLLYVAPATGSRQPGLYRTTIPTSAEDLIDSPVDEGPTPSPYPSNGYGQGYAQGEHSLPVPVPNPEESASLLSSPSSASKTVTAKTETKTKTKSQKQLAIPDQLDTLIDAWNQLPDGIAPRCNKRSAPLVAAWQRATGQPDVAAALRDVSKLMAAIREGSFLHGQPWFKFSWLFHKSRSGEFNAVKIIEGNYRDSNAKPRASAARWQGDADDFAHLATPAPAAAAAGASRELESRSA